MTAKPNAFSQYPDAQGRFGEFGGRYVAETLMPNILALEKAYEDAKADPALPPSSRISSSIMSAAPALCILPSA